MCVVSMSDEKQRENKRSQQKSIDFFMLFLLAAERADAPTNDCLLDQDAEAADERIARRYGFFPGGRGQMFSGLKKKQQKRQVGKDKRAQTFLSTVRRTRLKLGPQQWR